MTISSSEIRRNMTIMLDGEVHQILEWQHRQATEGTADVDIEGSSAFDWECIREEAAR